MTRFDEQSKAYHELLEEVYQLFLRKGADYGRDEDHFANLRATEAIGIKAWIGAYIRMNDKMKRIETFILKGELQNESVDDSFEDIAVYALNALTIRREDKQHED